MKIVSETDTKLVIKSSLFGLFSSIGIFFLTFPALALIFGGEINLSCNRIDPSQGTCQLTESRLLGTQKRKIPLNEFRGAKLKETYDDEGYSYRVILLTNKGEQELTSWSYSDEEQQQSIAFKINSFLKNTEQKSLVVEQKFMADNTLVAIFTGLGFFSIIIGTLHVNTYTFDKTLNSVIIQQTNLSGTTVIKYEIQQIKDVKLEYDSEDSLHRITLILVSGNAIPFTSYYSGDNGQKVVPRLRQFLNLKSEE